MLYYSTNHGSPLVNFREATIAGQPPDKGLYFPELIPRLNDKFLRSFRDLTREEVAFEVIRPYTGDTIPRDVLKQIIADTISFDIPLVKVDEDVFALELFHGPTMAFKDVGARFMSRCLEYFVKDSNRKLVILTATSGDTGGAVASGFYKTDGIDVVILYPSGKVSNIQEAQLTRPGNNIHALEVNGSFDDCQRMVKLAFADHQLNANIALTSANSINVARWLPQQFYYFFALQQWTDDVPPVISVPSGNFGNLCAGLLACMSGLPVAHFIAACNQNDVVPQYFQTARYEPKPSVSTLSNAMDVGDPSNFIRILELFQFNFKTLSEIVSSYSISDNEIRSVIREVSETVNYLPDPHGAVAYASLKKYQKTFPGTKGIFLETAHPLKFNNVVEPLTGKEIKMPASIIDLLKKEKVAVQMQADYNELKNYLMRRF